MTRIISPLIAVCFLFFQVSAQSVYLKYDENCMDRLEYSGIDGLTPYVSYSLKTGVNSFMLLDIGKEDAKPQKNLPGKIVYCNALKFDRELANQVNSGALKLYIVQESPTQYVITQVDKANFFAKQGNVVQFLMEDTEFLMYTDNLVSQVNLALPNAQKEIYLSGTMRMQCLTGYVLQKKDRSNSATYKEYVFFPDFGIVEKSSVSGSASLDGSNRTGLLKLNKIGSMPLKDAVSLICDRQQASYYDGTGQNALTVKTGDIPTSFGNDPGAITGSNGTYIVQKGETMYGISRRFGISLDQLRSWNKLQSSDLIAVGQKLYIRDPATVTGNTGTTTAGTSTMTDKSGDQGYFMNAPEVYVVKLNDSVAKLANMFGYTEDRFRKMNALGPAENIFAGQKLRTTDCVCPTLASTTKDQPLPYEAETEKLTSYGNADVYFRPVKIHEVKKEDTLFSIAKLYDTSVERILELNGMKKGENIAPSQKIYVQ